MREYLDEKIEILMRI